ncbi:MbnP family copper-binding protein, partial [Methylosinus sp. Sm6]|uniref:MbnP family copper-binding protein n=1 Tax=Methylosinus sp. Sm6 TaxID=2866948 RepID=UPI001C993D4C
AAQAAGDKNAGGKAAGGKTQPVAVSFALTAGGKEVGCGAPLADLGSGHLSGKLHEARLYVYGFALIDAKGERTPIALTQSEWQYGDVALIDFKDARGGNAACTPGNPAKNTTVVGTAPSGRYVGLAFSVGAPVETMVDGKPVAINHSNVETAAPPLDISGMAWNWQAGRRFVTLEVIPPAPVIKPDGSKSRTWMVHVGSTGCKGNPATG